MIDLVQFGLYEMYGGEYSGCVFEFNRFEEHEQQFVFRIIYSPYRDAQEVVGKYVQYTFQDLDQYTFAEVGECRA